MRANVKGLCVYLCRQRRIHCGGRIQRESVERVTLQRLVRQHALQPLQIDGAYHPLNRCAQQRLCRNAKKLQGVFADLQDGHIG